MRKHLVIPVRLAYKDKAWEVGHNLQAMINSHPLLFEKLHENLPDLKPVELELVMSFILADTPLGLCRHCWRASGNRCQCENDE